MIEGVSVLRQVQIAVEIDFLPACVTACCGQKVLRQALFYLFAEGGVDHGQIQYGPFLCQLPVKDGTENDQGQQDQKDRPFVIGKYMLRLLGWAHRLKSRLVGGFFLF